MQTDFDPFIRKMIAEYEGGYCWDNGDPGGPTNFGITCYDLAEERHQQMTSMAAWAPLVKAMPETEALGIYGTKYKGDFDALPPGPDCAECDYKVNSGIGRVALVRPRILELAKKATVQDCDPAWYVDALCQERLHFLQGLRTWPKFGGGWGHRVANLKVYCDHLAAGGSHVTAPVTVQPPRVPKGQHAQPDAHATAGKIIATSAASSTAAASSSHTGLILACAGVAVVGVFALAVYEAHKAQAANAAVILPPTIRPHP